MRLTEKPCNTVYLQHNIYGAPPLRDEGLAVASHDEAAKLALTFQQKIQPRRSDNLAAIALPGNAFHIGDPLA